MVMRRRNSRVLRICWEKVKFVDQYGWSSKRFKCRHELIKCERKAENGFFLDGFLISVVNSVMRIKFDVKEVSYNFFTSVVVKGEVIYSITCYLFGKITSIIQTCAIKYSNNFFQISPCIDGEKNLHFPCDTSKETGIFFLYKVVKYSLVISYQESVIVLIFFSLLKNSRKKRKCILFFLFEKWTHLFGLWQTFSFSIAISLESKQWKENYFSSAKRILTRQDASFCVFS